MPERCCENVSAVGGTAGVVHHHNLQSPVLSAKVLAWLLFWLRLLLHPDHAQRSCLTAISLYRIGLKRTEGKWFCQILQHGPLQEGPKSGDMNPSPAEGADAVCSTSSFTRALGWQLFTWNGSSSSHCHKQHPSFPCAWMMGFGNDIGSVAGV